MSTLLPWTEAAVRRALSLPGAPGQRVFPSVSTDTRTVSPGALFVALSGERFDAHDFVAEAVERGAAGVVVHRDVDVDPGACVVFRVEDTLVALGALARARRRDLGVRGARVVAITGSSGKTTVKDMTRAALAAQWPVHATPGNLNNRVGLPLTILSAPLEARILLLEMGTNEPGEIATLTAIAEPDLGVVTTVGPAHLEKLGSVDGVLAEKTALVAGLPDEGWAVVGDEPGSLAARSRDLHARVAVAGWGPGADPELTPGDPLQGPDGCWSFTWQGRRVSLQVAGRHAVTDALLALAVASLLRVPPPLAAMAVSSLAGSGMRGERRTVGGLTLLVDCYNANPQSLRSALDTLVDVGAPGSRVVVMGSMLELGPSSPEWHRDLLLYALSLPIDRIVAVGLFGEAAREAAVVEGEDMDPRVFIASDAGAAGELLTRYLSGRETVLLKGSRGVALERIVPLLEQAFGQVPSLPAGEG